MKLRITLKKSPIACKQNQIKTVKALGLRKVGYSVEQPDNACIRGMIFRVKHMVEVAEIEE